MLFRSVHNYSTKMRLSEVEKFNLYLLMHVSLIKINEFKEKRKVYLECILSGTRTGGTLEIK